jgi:hypothetical protein
MVWDDMMWLLWLHVVTFNGLCRPSVVRVRMRASSWIDHSSISLLLPRTSAILARRAQVPCGTAFVVHVCVCALCLWSLPGSLRAVFRLDLFVVLIDVKVALYPLAVASHFCGQALSFPRREVLLRVFERDVEIALFPESALREDIVRSFGRLLFLWERPFHWICLVSVEVVLVALPAWC